MSEWGGGKLRRLFWEICWAALARPTPRWMLNGWRRTLLRLFGSRIGKDVRIQGSSHVWQPWKLVIGANSWIDANVRLYTVAPITIGSNAVISEGAFICTASHDVRSENFRLTAAPIEIEDCAWVCARAIVLPGVKIGEGAVVAAGAVVTRDVAPWTVVAGNPAKEVSRR